MRKLILFLLLFTSCSFGVKKNKNLQYYSNIEKAIINYGLNDSSYMKNLNEAYKINKDSDLLYEVLLSNFDEITISTFFADNVDNKGYGNFFNDRIDENNLGNENSARKVFLEKYKNLEFDKAYDIISKGNITLDSYIFKNFSENKEKFFDIQKRYENYLDNDLNEEQTKKLAIDIISNLKDYKLSYEILKPYIKENYDYALFCRYMTMDKSTDRAKEILKGLVEKGFILAIIEDIKQNSNVNVNNKYYYDKQLVFELYKKDYERSDFSSLRQHFEFIKDYDRAYSFIAKVHFYNADLKTAYKYYKLAYESGDSSKEVIDKLVDLSIKFNEQKEILKLTNGYMGKFNEKRTELEFNMASNLESKKRSALKMWCINKKKASEFLIQLTKDKTAIKYYTRVMKGEL